MAHVSANLMLFPRVWHDREDEGVLCLQDHFPGPFLSSTTNSHLHKHVPAFICEELRIRLSMCISFVDQNGVMGFCPKL